jgi:RHH-type transcriptional regulator, rel operon repressor / antitoxin RelB
MPLYSRGHSIADSTVLTLRLDQNLHNRLDKLAKSTKRSRSFLAAEAIRDYVALNDWQIEEIRKGIAEANRGEFASPAEVARLRKKWTRGAR